ncbi:nephrin isoform X2 [Ischnura elegans]|uniref:nephrin isoform X2 n=1 Tax=Ischnura elegans TaxID=197161 RepID=UPI001ED8B490|nr:nephrin isoform X2 [Ischnura elegans]
MSPLRRPCRTPHSCLGYILLLGIVYFASSDDVIDFQKNLPAEVVWVVQGKDAELPCDIRPPRINDRINMVLWFKDNEGVPLYSLDARGKGVGAAHHWAMTSDLGNRAHFNPGDDATTATLRVSQVVPSDEGVYRCRIDFFDSPSRNFKVNLSIVVPPTRPIVYDINGDEVTGSAAHFREGYEIFLTCHVIDGRPKSHISWWLGSKLLDDALESGSADETSVNNLLIPIADRSLHGAVITCRASNSNLTRPVAVDITIELYLKPLAVLMTDRAGSREGGRGPLSAGRESTHRCEAWGSVPPAKITWLLDGEVMRNEKWTISHLTNHSVSVLTYTPKAEDDGKYLTCRAENSKFSGGFLEDRKRLKVFYAPVPTVTMGPMVDPDNLKEGDTIYLRCGVWANPPANFTAWYHQGERVRSDPLRASATLIGDGSLMLREATRWASGEYVCEARNSEGIARSEPHRLRIQYAPRCRPPEESTGVATRPQPPTTVSGTSRQVGALRHETLRIRCEVDADPSDGVRFSWTYNKSREVLHVPASRVISEGPLVSSLNYTPASAADFGTLACWASNAIGRQREPCLFHIVPARAPKPPEDCSLIKSMADGDVVGLRVSCSPGFDGGLPQHFVLEVTPSGASIPDEEEAMGAGNELGAGASGEERQQQDGVAPLRPSGPFGADPDASTVVYRALGAEPVFSLDALKPGRPYDVSVHAANAKGRSEAVVIPRVQPSAPPNAHHSKPHPGGDAMTMTDSDAAVAGDVIQQEPMAIVLGVLISAASLVLCGIFALAAILICRRRRSNMSSARSDQATRDADSNDSASAGFGVALETTATATPRVRFRIDGATVAPEERTSVASSSVRWSRGAGDDTILVDTFGSARAITRDVGIFPDGSLAMHLPDVTSALACDIRLEN